MSKNIVDFCQTVTAAFPKLQSTCPEKNFERKKMKKDDFLEILYFEWKNLEIGRTNFGRVCQKCILRVQGSSQRKKNLCKKRGFIVLLVPWGKICRPLSKKILEVLAKNLLCVFQNFILRVQRPFLRKNFFENDDFLVIFVPWENNFGQLRGKFYGAQQTIYYRVFETAIYLSRETNWEFFWGKLWFFNLFRNLAKIILVFGKKLSPRGVKTALRESKWRLWGFFLKKPGFFVNSAPWAEKFRTFAKHLRQGFQNINRSVQGVFLQESFKQLMIF